MTCWGHSLWGRDSLECTVACGVWREALAVGRLSVVGPEASLVFSEVHTVRCLVSGHLGSIRTGFSGRRGNPCFTQSAPIIIMIMIDHYDYRG